MKHNQNPFIIIWVFLVAFMLLIILSKRANEYTEQTNESESFVEVTVQTEKKTKAPNTKATTAPETSTTNSLQVTSKLKPTDPYIAKKLGTFNLTFYTPYEEDGRWGYQTATGATSKHLQTCAVDPNIIPLYSVIRIEGNNRQVITLRAVDIGGGIKGNRIDIFFDGDSESADNWIEDFGEIHSVYLLEE